MRARPFLEGIIPRNIVELIGDIVILLGQSVDMAIWVLSHDGRFTMNVYIYITGLIVSETTLLHVLRAMPWGNKIE